MTFIINFTLKLFVYSKTKISGGIHIYKGVGVRFAHFISFFLNIP